MTSTLTQFQQIPTLVVDDDKITMEILVEMLKMLGIEAESAEDGEVAVGKAKEKPYDLILMDIRMPKKDGCTASREIRTMPIKQPVIIGITAYSFLSDTESCGMQEHIAKPLEIERLVERLKHYFPQRILEQS